MPGSGGNDPPRRNQQTRRKHEIDSPKVTRSSNGNDPPRRNQQTPGMHEIDEDGYGYDYDTDSDSSDDPYKPTTRPHPIDGEDYDAGIVLIDLIVIIIVRYGSIFFRFVFF